MSKIISAKRDGDKILVTLWGTHGCGAQITEEYDEAFVVGQLARSLTQTMLAGPIDRWDSSAFDEVVFYGACTSALGPLIEARVNELLESAK